MQQLNFVRSRCVVKNISKRAVKLLGRATLPPSGEPCDLFEVIPNLSEILIVDALRQPAGELYQRKLEGQIEILECDLVIFNNANVKPVLNISGITTLNAEHPLVFKDGQLKMQQANEYNDGFLSKFDFIDLKRQSFKITVWQYQDFEAVSDLTLKISQFNNFNFDANAIVNGSAFVVDANNQDNLVYRGSVFQKMIGKADAVKVQNHVKDTVLLDSKVPDGKTLRVYFLVSALPHDLNSNKVLPVVPDVARRARIEVIEANTVESGKSSVVAGEKRFINKTIFANVGVGCDPGELALSVDGDIKGKRLSVTDGAKAGHVLTSNSLGDATWKTIPLVSETAPLTDVPGALWLKVPEQILYYFNTDMKSWLSVDSEFVTLRSSQISISNAYLDIVDNGYAQTPSIIKMFDYVLTDMEFEVECTAPLAVELHSDSGLIKEERYEITEGSKKHFKELNVFLKAGVPLRVFVNGSNIVKPKVKLKIKAMV